MKSSLYDKVYDYLSCFEPNVQGFKEYTWYMNSLRNVICAVVNESIMTQGRMSDIASVFGKIAGEANKPLKILVAGEFKTGKSTFINLLLGKKILKSDVMPATAVVTHICYGEKENVLVELKDGTRWNYPLSVLEFLTAEGNAYYATLRKNIKTVYVQLPLEFLRYVTLIDSPGINVDISYHVKATQSAFEDVDFVIWIMNMAQAAKKGEIQEIKKMPKNLKPVVIINGIDLIDSEEEDVDEAVEKAIRRVKSHALCSFGVSALETHLAIERNDIAAYREYGWDAFLQYFKQMICKNWFVWKAQAMTGKIKRYNDIDLSKHYDDYMIKREEYEKILSSNKQKHWFEIEELRMKRDTLKNIILESDEIVANLIHWETKTILDSELKRIGSLMEGMSILRQEMIIQNPFSTEQCAEMQGIYQYYQQLWWYLQSYVSMFLQGNHNQAVVDNMYVAANNIIGCNKAYIDTYMNFSDMQDEIENQYYVENKNQIDELKTAIQELTELDNRMEGMTIFTKIQMQINLEI